MTTTTATKTDITPEQRLTVMKHLAGGKDLDTTATLTRRDRSEVLDIASKHGYPSTEAMRRAVTILEKNLEEDLAPMRHPEASRIATKMAESARPTAPATPAAGLTRPDEIRVLLNTAKGHPSKRIQRQADKERAAAKAEVDRLEAQLRAAREKLRGPRAATSAGKAQTGGSQAAKIRTWARENGLDVPDRGVLPAAVRQAYDDAHKDD